MKIKTKSTKIKIQSGIKAGGNGWNHNEKLVVCK
jgi:hypothetical protein